MLWTAGTNGPVDFTFAIGNIAGMGFNIQNDYWGTFTAYLEAFDSLDNSLGSVSEVDTASPAGDASAIFIGILSYSQNIARIHVWTSDTADVPGSANDFAMGPATIQGEGQIPEPGTLALLGSGLIAAAVWRRRRK